MSGTTTVTQPLAITKTPTSNILSSAPSTPSSSPRNNPSTPKSQHAPSPGRWQHPKLKEIALRQAALRFSERGAKIAGTNTALLLLTLYFRSNLHALLAYAASPLNDLYPSTSTATYILTLLRLYILLNIALTLRPVLPAYLAAKPDPASDIPLTPSQRSLLGLAPSPAGSPSSTFITPPRYRRSSASGSFTSSTSSTPHTHTPPSNSNRSISATYGTSPLSTSRYTLGFSPGGGSPIGQSPFRSTQQRTASGSPFMYSPSASPLLHKAINNRGLEESTFGASTSGFSPGGLSRSQSVKERGTRDMGGNVNGSASPSPVGFSGGGGVKRDPGLNYKWLYQTGRGTGARGGGGMPKSESMNF